MQRGVLTVSNSSYFWVSYECLLAWEMNSYLFFLASSHLTSVLLIKSFSTLISSYIKNQWWQHVLNGLLVSSGQSQTWDHMLPSLKRNTTFPTYARWHALDSNQTASMKSWIDFHWCCCCWFRTPQSSVRHSTKEWLGGGTPIEAIASKGSRATVAFHQPTATTASVAIYTTVGGGTDGNRPGWKTYLLHLLQKTSRKCR